MLLKQSKTFYFLWWNKKNIKERKTTSHFSCEINNISLKIINKLRFLGVPPNFPRQMGDLPIHKEDQTKTFSRISRRISKLKNKSCVTEKMPDPALRFVYSHSYNDYVKIVSATTRQIKLKNILIKQKHVIQIQGSCKNLCKTIISRIKHSWNMSNKPALSLIFMQRIRRTTSPSVFSSYFKIINHVYKAGFSKVNFKI